MATGSHLVPRTFKGLKVVRSSGSWEGFGSSDALDAHQDDYGPALNPWFETALTESLRKNGSWTVSEETVQSREAKLEMS